MSASALPDTSGLTRVLSQYAGRTAYVVPMTTRAGVPLGNNGDAIMLEIFERVLADHGIASVSPTSTPAVVIVPPSGSLLEVYSFPGILAERIADLASTPLIIMPSSAYFPTADPAFMFAGRDASTTWILREANSLEHLTTQWGASLEHAGVELILDHDIVAAGHEFVPDLLGGISGGHHVLIAARIDREGKSVTSGPTHSSSSSAWLRKLFQILPYGRLATKLARIVRRQRLDHAADELVASVPEPLRRDLNLATGKVLKCDASATQFATYDEYARMVRDARVVVTNRLHVALPAAILGKPVILVEAGYHKLSGVYNQSLVNLENVTLVNPGRDKR